MVLTILIISLIVSIISTTISKVSILITNISILRNRVSIIIHGSAPLRCQPCIKNTTVINVQYLSRSCTHI